MSKFFVEHFWGCLKVLLEKSKIAAIALTCFISFLIFVSVVNHKEQIILGFPKNSWLAVVGSLLAATIFLVIQWFISLLETAEQNVFKQKYAELVGEHGIKGIYAQRGGHEAVQLYRRILKGAKSRIWAIGMTNSNFIEQHFDQILKLLEENKSIDVIIGFWDPQSRLLTPTHKIQDRCILDVQNLIEQKTTFHTDWLVAIGERQTDLIRKLNEKKELRGSIKIINISTVANFTSFLIDDDLFFFPFVSGPHSTNNPTICCSAIDGIGISIVEHVNNIVKNADLTDIIFERVKNDIRINKVSSNC